VISVLKKTAGFYLPFILFIGIGGVHLAFNYSDGLWVLWFCEHFDITRYEMFSWFTLLGEPQVLIPLAFIFFLFNFGRGVFVVSTWFIASAVTIILKGIIANHRPAYYFEDIFISCAGELSLWYNLSTPSGHTTAAFAFFAALAITTKNKGVQLVFLLVALLAGLSRLVLFMHYFYDVYFGAIIGAACALIVWWCLNNNDRLKFVLWKNNTYRDLRK
tara:strand:+ start:6717 stop:7367 length:651 start_codon:yes stop_codon:yes gene_type:complete